MTLTPRKASAREQAQRLLREARRIFIIYSNADLERARDLRRRIIRLRRDKSEAAVFLAIESLAVGTDIARELLQKELTDADLAVVACGEDTSQRDLVLDEVRQALHQRESGHTEILPVILKTGVRLPEGLDFSIHAIHYAVLFPAIKRTRIALAGVLSVLIVSAVFFARQVRVVEIQRRIDLEADERSSPLDLQRVTRLEDLRTAARSVVFLGGLQQVDGMLERAGRSDLRQEWLPPDRRRIAVVADPVDNVIWVGYKERIDALDAATRAVVRSYNLAAEFDLDAYRPEPIGGRPPARVHEPEPRDPAQLVELRTDPRVRGVVATVEYESGEQEVLRLAASLVRPESVGLSVSLRWHTVLTAEGEDLGVGGEELEDTATEVEETLSKIADGDLRLARAAAEATGADDRIFSLARDFLGRGLLIGVERNLPGSRKDYLAGVLLPTGEFRQMVPTTLYADNASDLNAMERAARAIEGEDPGVTESTFSSAVPNYQPAALWIQGELAWIGGALTSFAGDHPRLLEEVIPENTYVESVRWLSGGAAVRFVFGDGSLSVWFTEGKGGNHRFLRPPGARAIDLTPDGKRVLVLDAEHRVYAWEITAFGTDGWVRPAGSSI